MAKKYPGSTQQRKPKLKYTPKSKNMSYTRPTKKIPTSKPLRNKGKSPESGISTHHVDPDYNTNRPVSIIVYSTF